MHKALLLAFAAGISLGSLAPDDQVSAPVLKKAMQRFKLPESSDDDDSGKGPAKLTLAQIREAATQAKRSVSGVSDFLRLDSRTQFIENKGILSVYFASYIKPRANSIRLVNHGIVSLEFLAQAKRTTYLVDFQLDVRSQDTSIQYHAGEQTTESTLSKGLNHVLLFVDANGGWQHTILVLEKGNVSFKGVEVSVAN